MHIGLEEYYREEKIYLASSAKFRIKNGLSRERKDKNYH
jgi:hypothetical protein